MGWTGCVRYKKFQHDFIVQTCALIAPVQPVLHRLSWSNDMVRNAPKLQFGVQLGGSSGLDAKNSDATSMDELVH
jgi:hypothetical protein